MRPLPLPSPALQRDEQADPVFALPSRSGYKLNKIEENNEAEIMEVVLADARESYAEEVVVELRSESPEEMEENVGRILQWVQGWKANNGDDSDDEA